MLGFRKREKANSAKNLGESGWWVGFLDTFSADPEIARELFFKRMLDENVERLEYIKSGFAANGVKFEVNSVLDVGNGPCGLLTAFSDLVAKTGCDPNNPNYESASILHNPRGSINFYNESHQIKGKQLFDFISCVNVLDHVLDPGKVLIDIRRLIKPTGLIWLSVDTRKQEETHTVHPHALNEEIMASLLKDFRIVNFSDEKKCYDEHPTNKRLDYWLAG